MHRNTGGSKASAALAEKRFREVSEAYEVLGNGKSRFTCMRVCPCYREVWVSHHNVNLCPQTLEGTCTTEECQQGMVLKPAASSGHLQPVRTTTVPPELSPAGQTIATGLRSIQVSLLTVA